MPRRMLAFAAGLMLVGAVAPAAHADYKAQRVQPPSCNTTIGNVVGGDPICEPTELRQPTS